MTSSPAANPSRCSSSTPPNKPRHEPRQASWSAAALCRFPHHWMLVVRFWMLDVSNQLCVLCISVANLGALSLCPPWLNLGPILDATRNTEAPIRHQYHALLIHLMHFGQHLENNFAFCTDFPDSKLKSPVIIERHIYRCKISSGGSGEAIRTAGRLKNTKRKKSRYEKRYL